MATVIDKGEISLYNVLYPIDGQVTEQSIPVFANKQVFGDVTRMDQLSTSQFIMNDWRDGGGVYEYAEANSVTSFYDSSAETRIKGWISIPHRAQVRLGGTVSGTPVGWAQKNGIDFYAAGTAVHSQDVSATVSGTASMSFTVRGTTPAPITDILTYKNSLFVAMGTAGYMYGTAPTGAALTWGTVTGATAYYFAEYDSKLLCLSASTAQAGIATLFWTTSATPSAGTASWTEKSIFTDLATDVTGMKVFVNSQGTDTPWIFTRSGVRVVDFGSNAVYKPKGLQFGDGSSDNCLAFATSRGGGEGFLAVRQDVYRLSGQNVYPTSPTRELRVEVPVADGNWFAPREMPVLYRGVVRALTTTDRYIIAAMDRKDTTNGTSFIYAWNGRGWHAIASFAGSTRTVHYTRRASDPNNPDVLWFDQGGELYWIKQPDVSDNPALYVTPNAGTAAIHTTGWFDGNFAEVDKLAIQLDGQLLTGGSVIVRYALNHDDTNWITQSTVSSTVAASLPYASGAGTVFRSIRFQYELRGGGTIDPKWFASLKYAVVPDSLQAWRFTVDCSKEYKGNQPAELLAAIKTAYATKTLGVFSFQPNDDHYVKVMQRAGKEETGQGSEGHIQVMVAEWT